MIRSLKSGVIVSWKMIFIIVLCSMWLWLMVVEKIQESTKAARWWAQVSYISILEVLKW